MLRPPSEVLNRVRRLIGQLALDGSPAELIELRDAIVEDVAKHCHALSGGSVFPYCVIEAGIYTGTDDRRLVVERNLGAPSGLPADVRRAIERQGCTAPGDLKGKVIALDARPGDRDWRVEYSEARNNRPDLAGNAGRQPYLVVISGETQQAEFRLQTGSVNIGRGAEIRFSREIRRNDVVFLDNSGAGRSVSRDHARIDCDADGNCSLVQKNGKNRTELRRRNGQPFPVSAHGPAGGVAGWRRDPARGRAPPLRTAVDAPRGSNI
jgi:hypothetical protein